MRFDIFKRRKESPNPYFGCVNGRCANRIKNGEFRLDGVSYQLAKNCPAGPNAVHGGVKVRQTKYFLIFRGFLLSVNINLT